MISSTQFNIFKKGSTTYFYSSLFFAGALRQEVFTLYAFVRVVDDFVDAVPQEKNSFYRFKKLYHRSLAGNPVHDPIIDPFTELMRAHQIKPEWIEAFFLAMEADLDKSTYQTIQETQAYMYGSAEVIGLILATLMRLPPQAFYSARMLGKAMQYTNFLRDINEDLGFGRQYIPSSSLQKFGLPNLHKETASAHKESFIALIRQECRRNAAWYNQAQPGIQMIPKRERIPIATAGKLYWWTLQQIYQDPFLIYQKKLKPGKLRIMSTLVQEALL